MDEPQLFTAKRMSSLARLGLTVLAGTILLIGILVLGELADSAAKLQTQVRLADDKVTKARRLLKQGDQLLEARQRDLDIAQAWLEKLAIPRETILKAAKLDASQGDPANMERLSAHATLGKDGWIVTCKFYGSLITPPSIFHCLIDPATGRILTKRVERESDQSGWDEL